MATNEGRRKTLKAEAPAARAAAPLLAYVLHRYDWSESSLIVELYTRERGRLVAVAKGAKRPTSQLRSVLLPFQPVQALLGKTPADPGSDVHLLRSAEWQGGQPLLGAALLFSGFYANELLLKLLPRDESQPELFDAYADTLAALALASDASAEASALRAFELRLLRHQGWLPDLGQVTQTTAALQPAGRYGLDGEAGLGPDAHGASGATWAALEGALQRRHGAALRAVCALEAGALRAPLRRLLAYHLEAAPLRTRQVWQGLQRTLQLPAP